MSDPLPVELTDGTTVKRFENLGDNCEFGFVLKSLQNEDGSFFRWAAASADQVLAALRNDLEHSYDFECLSPWTTGMVRDSTYGIAWHTEMKSRQADGALAFIDDEAERRNIHAIELRKVEYLRRKFMYRIRAGGVIYVLKGCQGLSPAVVDDIHQQLTRLSGGAPFWLLEVVQTGDPALCGTAAAVEGNRLRAYMSKFAHFASTNIAEYEEWYALLAKVLALAPFQDWPAVEAAQQAAFDTGQVTRTLAMAV